MEPRSGKGVSRDSASRKEFSWIEGLAICLGMIGVQLTSEVIAGWGNFFYTPPEGTGRIVFVTAGMAAIIFAAGRLFDAVTDPLIGMWSDRVRTQPGKRRFLRLAGRRRPFMFWGSVLMTITGIAFWYPPVPGTSWANCAYGTLIVCLHWGLFTICVVPLKSLEPEIARSQQARVRLGIWVGIGMITGLAVSQILPGIVIDALDPVEAGEGQHSPEAFQRAAMLFAFAALVLLQLPVWLVRERYETPQEKPPRVQLLGQLAGAFWNRPFFCYFMTFFSFSIGVLAVQRVVGHWAVLGLGGDEGYVSLLMAPFILTAYCSLALVPLITRRLEIKWLMCLCPIIYATGLPLMYFIARAEVDPSVLPAWLMDRWMPLLGTDDPVSAVKTLMGAGLFAYCGIAQGVFYAILTPLMGQIIDFDARRTGKRREALYSGLHGVAFKGSQTLSIVVANLSMAYWGKSVESPWGVYYVGLIAGVFGLVGLAFALAYPILPGGSEGDDAPQPTP